MSETHIWRRCARGVQWHILGGRAWREFGKNLPRPALYVIIIIVITQIYIYIYIYFTVYSCWTTRSPSDHSPSVTPTCLLLIIWYHVTAAVLHLRHCRPHPSIHTCTTTTTITTSIITITNTTTTVDLRDFGLTRAHGEI